MANQEQVDRLLQGVEAWNRWREENLDVKVGLRDADLSGADLENITWDKDTIWDGAKNLETVVDMPEELKQHLGLIEKDGE